MRTREERRQRAREVRWIIEHPDITAAMRTGYPSWDNPYLMAKCDELLDYIEDEKWGDRIPGGWNG